MFEPSIQAATTKINQLRDITQLIKTTYGEDFSKLLPVTEEDAQVFKQALRVGMTIPADILEKYSKFFTTEDFAAWSEAKKKETATGLTPVQVYDREQKLADSFEKYTKDSKTALRGINIVNEGYQQAITALKEGGSLNAQSQAVIIGFNKLIDPTSVVRESEYARTPEGQSLWNNLRGRYLQLTQGGAGLTAEGLRNIKDTAIALLKGYEQDMINEAKRIQYIADKQGFDIKSILTPEALNLLNRATETGLREQVILKGYDYDAMKGQGYSDEEIKQSLGL